MPWHDRAGRLADPEQEELEDWVPPAAALKGVPMTPALAKTLHQRLLSRELVAAARIARFSNRLSRNVPYPCITIDPEWWNQVLDGPLDEAHPLWAHGDVKIMVPARGGDQNTAVLFCDVHFEPSGLEGIVPRGTMPTAASARSQRIATYPADQASADRPREWIPARSARDMVGPLYSDGTLVERAIVSEAAGGRIATRCQERWLIDRDSGDVRRRYVGLSLDATFWLRFEAASQRNADWIAGRFSYSAQVNLNHEETRLFGTEFCANDIRRVFDLGPGPAHDAAVALYRHKKSAAQVAVAAPPPRNQKRRGPPAKPFWEAAMADVEADIVAEKISASSLADVERALEAWLLDHNESAAESTVRRYADLVRKRLDLKGR